jgi:hypothetical protein
MIHLCYLKRRLDIDSFLDNTLQLKKSLRPTDMIITSRVPAGVSGKYTDFSFPTEEDIDLETISSQKISNILLLNFDEMEENFIQSIINLKSKDTEIIGISSYISKPYKDALFTIQDLKELTLNNDEICIYLTLKYNVRPEIIDLCLQEYKCQTKNLKIKEIDNIEEVKKLLKYPE